jgi:hypothetical protein
MSEQHLFAQSDLSEYARLAQQGEETTKQLKELKDKFLKAAEEAKAKGVKVADVTEPGALRIVVSLGDKNNTSWKSVVGSIEEKNCVFTNGGGKIVQLNSVLKDLTEKHTSPSPNNRVEVKPNIQ